MHGSVGGTGCTGIPVRNEAAWFPVTHMAAAYGKRLRRVAFVAVGPRAGRYGTVRFAYGRAARPVGLRHPAAPVSRPEEPTLI